MLLFKTGISDISDDGRDGGEIPDFREYNNRYLYTRIVEKKLNFTRSAGERILNTIGYPQMMMKCIGIRNRFKNQKENAKSKANRI